MRSDRPKRLRASDTKNLKKTDMKNTKKFTWKTKKTGQSVYSIITNKVVEGLEKQGLNWFKPWSTNGNIQTPINYKSRVVYSGINYWLLNAAMWEHGYSSPEFITAKQAVEKNAIINEDALEHIVVYYMVSYTYKKKWYPNEKALNNAGIDKKDKGVISKPSPRFYRVYNITDVTGLEPLAEAVKNKALENTIFEPITGAEDIYTNMPKKPSLKHGGDKAYYKPSTHHIQMPTKKQFSLKSGVSDDYYKTLFHEMVHSTGNEDLLNRSTLTGTASYASTKYSQEELVAEMGAMFLCGVLGLEPKDNITNSQAYINGWIKHLKSKDNEKDVLFASSQARKAVEYILKK